MIVLEADLDPICDFLEMVAKRALPNLMFRSKFIGKDIFLRETLN